MGYVEFYLKIAQFQDDYTILHFHQQCTKGAISLHASQHLVLSLFFILVILIVAVLICISLMASHVGQLHLCSFAICE